MLTNIEKMILDKSLDDIRRIVEGMSEQRDDAKRLVEDWEKDAEIKKLKEEIECLKKERINGFIFSSDQIREIKAWEQNHIRNYHKEEEKGKIRKSSGIHFEYCFSHTPVGTLSSVVCEECRKKAFKISKGDKEIYDKYMEENNAIIFPGEV